MALLQAVTSLNKRLSRTRRLLSDIDDLAGALEQRKPLDNIVGPGGAGDGRGGAQFLASSVGPGVGGFPEAGAGPGMPDLTGRSVTLGGGGDAGAAEGGSTGGVLNDETNRDKIGAIISELGIAPPEREAWDPQGTGPGEFPGFIINTVLAFGKNAPRRFLSWCAGWLAYGGTDRLSAHGQGGIGNRAGKRSRFREFVMEGGQASGLFNADARNLVNIRLDPGRSQGQLSGSGATSGGISPSQAKSITNSTSATAASTAQVVTAVKELTSVVKSAQSGVGTRAGGFV